MPKSKKVKKKVAKKANKKNSATNKENGQETAFKAGNTLSKGNRGGGRPKNIYKEMIKKYQPVALERLMLIAEGKIKIPQTVVTKDIIREVDCHVPIKDQVAACKAVLDQIKHLEISMDDDTKDFFAQRIELPPATTPEQLKEMFFKPKPEDVIDVEAEVIKEKGDSHEERS